MRAATSATGLASSLNRSNLSLLATLALFGLLPVDSVRPALALIGAGHLIACLLPIQLHRPVAALLGGLCLYGGLAGAWFVWPFYLLVPITLAAALCAATGCARDLLAPLRGGKLGLSEWILICLISATAGICLYAWTRIVDPDLTKYRALVPALPLLGLVAAGGAFAIINAVMEEFIWRGVLQGWLTTFVGKWPAVAVQAASFGAFHYLGFPSGFAGAVLAGTYGVLLGLLALRSAGLLAAIVAHVTADLVIFSIVAQQLSG
jgi:membrane protease YdiL (CAAX protease family)